MIHYQLRCTAEHAFDGWFAGSEAFERQSEAGLVACPHCADTNVTRALMAPAVPRKGASKVLTQPPAVKKTAQIPDIVRGALRELRRVVETECDYVGADFAEEARRIHYGEAERRGIYGESTREESEALAEEGIAFAQIPWVPPTDS
jgi:hypothetical protein